MIPGSRRSPGEGNGNPLQYTYLGNPMDRGVWKGRKSQINLANKPPPNNMWAFCLSLVVCLVGNEIVVLWDQVGSLILPTFDVMNVSL